MMKKEIDEELVTRRRSWLDFYCDILENCKQKILYTHLLFKVRMTSGKINKYLLKLNDKGLIEIKKITMKRSKNKRSYKYIEITSKGCEVLRKLNEIRELIE